MGHWGLTRTLAAAALLVAAPALAQQGPGWKMQGSLDAMAGQYFYNGGAGAVNGYFNGNLQLLRSLGTDSGFYLDATGNYTGFKQVNELAGGGTLFQQSMDYSLGAKWIKRVEGGYSFMPRLGVHSQLFRETTDETWGKGLYDFWRTEAGLTWERKTRLGIGVPWTYQFTLDLYYTHYPHFQSLASQFGTEQAAPDPGSRILDTVSTQLGYRSEFELPDFVSVYGFYSIDFISFNDQKVVDSQGQYLSALRSDSYQTLSVGASKRLNDLDVFGRVRPVVALSLIAADLFSNQNHFDADPSRLKFIGAYYDYWEARFDPSVNLTFLKTMTTARLGYEAALRFYTGRVTQNGDGSYTGDKLRQTSHSVFVEGTHPIWKGLCVKARGTWSAVSSNMDYQQTYVYNYHDYNYYAGLEWKF